MCLIRKETKRRRTRSGETVDLAGKEEDQQVRLKENGRGAKVITSEESRGGRGEDKIEFESRDEESSDKGRSRGE